MPQNGQKRFVDVDRLSDEGELRENETDRVLKKQENELEEETRMIQVTSNSLENKEDDDLNIRLRALILKEKVKTAESEVTKIEGDHNRLKMCFGGCCPLNCWSGYKVSKRAAIAHAEVKELLEGGGKMDAVTKRVVLALRPMPDSILPLSTTEILLGNAIKYLKDETVGMIGIWGMGGVGKTTLMKRINNHPEVESAGYNFVIWVIVSQEVNLERLQRDIAKSVRLEFKEQDTTTELQAERLRHFLKNKRFLLLLDDIWQAFDLEKLGIPSLDSSDNKVPQSKVVFTTRSEMVCDRMTAFPRQVRQKKIKVECLKPEEAWELFFANTGETVQSIIKSDGRVHDRARTVANKCAGLPLALVVIARAMSGNKTWHEWEVAVNSINDLRLPEFWVGETDPLYPVLKVSYDRLMNDQIRKCFLCCALWPEDHNIQKDDLIRCWLGMGLIANFSNINVAISEGHSIIESLKGAAMLEETTDFYFRICVKLHDIIRGMALWIASDCGEKRNKWIVRSGVEINTTIAQEAEIVSLMFSNVNSLSQFPYCPNLIALMLRENVVNRSVDVDGFIKNIPALTYLDLSYSDWPNSLVAKLSNLVGLQCLDLSGQRGLWLPTELVNLTKLKYLFIRNGVIESMPRGLISGLQKLEILDLSYTIYKGWEEEGQASVAELGSINAAGGLKGLGIMLRPSLLQRLSINHPHVVPLWHLQIIEEEEELKTFQLSKSLFPGGIFPRSLESFGLSLDGLEEMIIAGGKEDQFDNLVELQFHSLVKLRKISWEGGVVPQVLFQNLSSLTFSFCYKLKDVSWIAQLQYLEILIIEGCYEMEQVIGGAEDDGEEAAQEQDGIEAEAAENRVKIFPNLKFLRLRNLFNLRSFCSPQITFPSLQRVDIIACPQLKNLSFLKETKAKVTVFPTRIEPTGATLQGIDIEEREESTVSFEG